MPIDKEAIAEVDDDVLLADGLEDGYIGLTVNTHRVPVAVYDIEKCIAALMRRDGMTYEDADDFLEFNTVCCFVGERTPIFIRPIGVVEGGEPQAPQGDREAAGDAPEVRVARGLIRVEEEP